MPCVEFRLEVTQRRYWLLIGSLWLPAAGLQFAAGAVLGGVLALVAATGLATMSFIAGRYGVTLTPQYVVVHGLRHRTIPWYELRDVTVVDFVASRRVALHGADGSITRPLAPLHNWAQPDPDFDQKFSTIYEWWLGARQSAPFPPVRAQTAGIPQPPIRAVPPRSTVR